MEAELKNIDWEQRRYEIAKQMLSTISERKGIYDDRITVNAAVREAIAYADTLIKKLKTETETETETKQPEIFRACVNCIFFEHQLYNGVNFYCTRRQSLILGRDPNSWTDCNFFTEDRNSKSR